MAIYSVETRNGSIINVPDYSVLHIDGLEIIGDQTTDWNEPYNKNFLALDKKIMAVEGMIGSGGEVDLSGITSEITKVKDELAVVKASVVANEANDVDVASIVSTLSARVDSAIASVSGKVDKVVGKGLSTEDYTSAEKAKLSLVEAGAQVNSVLSVAGKTGNVGLVIGDVAGLPEALAAGTVNDVTSVAGRKGDVVLSVSDIVGLSNTLDTTSVAIQNDIATIKSAVTGHAGDFFGDGSHVATFTLNGTPNSVDGKYKPILTDEVKWMPAQNGLLGATAYGYQRNIPTGYFLPSTVTSLTVSSWIKFDTSPSILFSLSNYEGTNGQLISFSGGIDNHFYTSGIGGGTTFKSSAYKVNDWNHIVVTFNVNNSTIKLFVNGVEAPTILNNITTLQSIVGKELRLAYSLKGVMYNAKVFERALTLAEVNRLYTEDKAISNFEDVYDVMISKTEELTTAVAAKVDSAYVDNKIQAVVGAAPATLDTLKELSDKLLNDESTIGAITTALANKVDRVIGKDLSTNDFSSAYRTKLDGLNNYVKPTSESIGYITGLQASLDAKVDIVVGKGLSTEDYTTVEKTKLAGLSNYVKPLSEPISYITGLQTALDDAKNNANVSNISGDILPAASSTYNIGSATQRWKGIYVDEAYLAVHTLYLGDTPILGTEQDTIVIKANANQSINMQTSGTGTTDITSQNGVQISTSGTNADVKVQATGTNSKVRFAGSGGIELSSPVSAQSDVSVSGNLTVSGNIVHNGAQFIVNATTVTAKDNIIVVNQGEVGTGVTAGKAGIQVDRGEAADYQLVFDETIDKFVVGAVGGVYETLATREYVSGAIAGVDLSSKANIQHTHAIIDVNGLSEALAGKISFTGTNALDLGVI